MPSRGNSDEGEPTAERVDTQHQGENEVDIESMQAEWNRLDPVASLERYLKLQQRIQQLEEEAARRAERDRRATETEQLVPGIYYATFDEVWDAVAVPFDESHYDAMKREKPPKYKTLDIQIKNPFQETLKKARDGNLVTADDSNSTRNSHNDSARKMEIWPVEVFASNYDDRGNPGKFLLPPGTALTEADRATASRPVRPPGLAPDADVGHLLPASPGLASLYHHVAIWVYGRTVERESTPQLVQKLIHGSRPSSEQSEQPIHRATGTGLKHMICNKIRLYGQAPYFDKNPCLIMVPLLSLEQAKEWKGEGYHAIAMISKGTKKGEGVSLERVAAAVNMQNKGVEASKREIEEARKLLTATVKALAYSVLTRPEKDSEWLDELPNGKWAGEWNKLRNNLSLITGEEKIKVPTVRRNNNDKPVRKIAFAPAFPPHVECGHPAPDPLLLTVKAGLNWSAFHGQNLMPVGEDDDMLSDRSLAAMDEHLEMIGQHERANRHEELMNMTINIA